MLANEGKDHGTQIGLFQLHDWAGADVDLARHVPRLIHQREVTLAGEADKKRTSQKVRVAHTRSRAP
jgi:hypothetical protein